MYEMCVEISMIYIFMRDAYAQRGLCCRKMSVCLSHAGILSKRPNVSSSFFTID